MKKPEKKSKRPPGPFNFCPKHNVFFISCGCKWQKGKADKQEVETIELIEENE